MRYFIRLIEILLLVVFIVLTLKNSQLVEFKLLMGYSWNAPLIVFLLMFFVFGAVVGLMAALGYYFRMRRELTHLKKELREKPSIAVIADEEKPAN